MKYEITFKNGRTLSFTSPEDIDLHVVDMEHPLVFNNLLVNLAEVLAIIKEQET